VFDCDTVLTGGTGTAAADDEDRLVSSLEDLLWLICCCILCCAPWLKLCVRIAGVGIAPYCAPVCGGFGGPVAAAGGGGGGFVLGWGTAPGLCVWLGGGGGAPGFRTDPLEEEKGAGLALGGVSEGVEFRLD